MTRLAAPLLLLLLLSLALISVGSSAVAAEDANQAAALELFEAKIRPLLVAKCYQCHSAEAALAGKLKGGLLLDSRQGIRTGGDTGPAVVPGDVKLSLLISALKHEDFEMPPQGKLPANVIADFVKWVELGAADPREQVRTAQDAPAIERATPAFWSYQPVKRPQPPQVKNASWPRGEIDRFLLAGMEQAGIGPVEDADRLSLVRRVYFDLVGLPPSPAQVDEFLADDSPESLERLIDHLLASPQFGERWGRHWLDVARYAESNGNVRNQTFPHAWRYRDYVIEALNADTPYDMFIAQQVAGDLLPSASPRERNTHLTATGFLALASKPQNRATPNMDVIADQIEVTTRAVLGLTVACARCHDHKFDPVATRDYYALAGVFASSETLYGGGQGNNMGAFAPTELHTLASLDPAEQRRVEAYLSELQSLRDEQAQLQRQLKGAAKGKAKGKPKGNKKDAAKASDNAQSKAETGDKLKQRADEVNRKIKALQANAPTLPGEAMGVKEAGKPIDVPVYIRGEKAAGDPVPRGFVEVVQVDERATIPPAVSGRRELADWLTRPENPLTARVMVNRIWLHLFGAGIVRTPDNFGMNGERPTHPELLDWLAARFVEHGWSTKQMIREIMLTRAYQLASTHAPGNFETDPDNLLIWRHERRRLEGEAIRDAVLAASGQLDLEPPQGSVVTAIGDTLIQDNVTVDQFHQPSNHRSVYLPVIRNGVPEMLNVFDFADPSLVVGARNITTVPAQELYLINSPFIVEQSRHFARLLLASTEADSAAKDDAARVRLAYRRALGRAADEKEIARALDFIAGSQAALAESKEDAAVAAWASFCQALFVSAEFRHVR